MKTSFIYFLEGRGDLKFEDSLKECHERAYSEIDYFTFIQLVEIELKDRMAKIVENHEKEKKDRSLAIRKFRYALDVFDQFMDTNYRNKIYVKILENLTGNRTEDYEMITKELDDFTHFIHNDIITEFWDKYWED